MSGIAERLARMEQKLDDFIILQKLQHEERRISCELHLSKTENLEKDKAKIIGAGKLLIWLGSGGTLAGLVVKLLSHKPTP